jgi:hypothetical protein
MGAPFITVADVVVGASARFADFVLRLNDFSSTPIRVGYSAGKRSAGITRDPHSDNGAVTFAPGEIEIRCGCRFRPRMMSSASTCSFRRGRRLDDQPNSVSRTGPRSVHRSRAAAEGKREEAMERPGSQQFACLSITLTATAVCSARAPPPLSGSEGARGRGPSRRH